MPRMQVGTINMQLNRKDIKNLHISVLPPDGRVRVSAPLAMTETAIRMAVINRIPWIKKQKNNFSKQPRQSPREIVTGECHYLWGKRHRINVIERAGRHEIKLSKNKLYLYVNPNTSLENRELVLSQYYRFELKKRIDELLLYWKDIIGISLSSFGIKKMKTKWGSCNIEAKRIWLNLELAKKPPECLEYILVHELLHLTQRKHNERFKASIDKFLPDWSERRDLLNRMPLAYSNWVY